MRQGIIFRFLSINFQYNDLEIFFRISFFFFLIFLKYTSLKIEKYFSYIFFANLSPYLLNYLNQFFYHIIEIERLTNNGIKLIIEIVSLFFVIEFNKDKFIFISIDRLNR